MDRWYACYGCLPTRAYTNSWQSMNEYAGNLNLALMERFFNEILVGFDVIFWLHHCNVDRLYAFWEYLYPEYWIERGWKKSDSGDIVPFGMYISHSISLRHHSCSPVTDFGTFYQAPGRQVDETTQLHPFRTKASDYWTSSDARDLLSTSQTNKCERFCFI